MKAREEGTERNGRTSERAGGRANEPESGWSSNSLIDPHAFPHQHGFISNIIYSEVRSVVSQAVGRSVDEPGPASRESGMEVNLKQR